MKSRSFRKKPIVVEAVQLKWDNWEEMCTFADVGANHEKQPHGCFITKDGKATDEATPIIGMQIPTLEGTMLATQGDWVIRGISGELYPCKPDIFEKTYDAVIDPNAK